MDLLNRRLYLRLFAQVIIAVSCRMKRYLALDDFLESDPSRLMFGGVDIDTRPRSTLKLFAALGGQNDQTILGINLLRMRLFCCLDNLFANFGSHKMFW